MLPNELLGSPGFACLDAIDPIKKQTRDFIRRKPATFIQPLETLPSSVFRRVFLVRLLGPSLWNSALF
jgi:hypothetical protein